MKKLLLALIVTLSFSSAMAEKNNTFVLTKASAPTEILNERNVLKTKKNFCAQQCLAEFQTCINNIGAGQGGSWVECEIAFENCMADCGI